MENPNILLAITPIPFLSVLVWIVLVLTAMYLARKPFHRTVASLSRMFYNGMRLIASSIKLAERRIEERNRAVLLSAGLEAAERKVEREFERIGSELQKELEGFPLIQRKLNEHLQKLEEDYSRCGEIPQELSDWVRVIEAIANIKPNGDRMVVNMLEEIHQTLNEQHKTAAECHRRDVAERHKILSQMQPTWRMLRKILCSIEKGFGQLTQRSKKIDRYMDIYEKTRNHSDIAARQLSSSATTQFFVSAVVLAIAAVGAVINFNLIVLPISEMIGGASYIGGLKSHEVAGAFIVCVEIVLGVFLMDALRATRFFSIIGSMEEHKRKAALLCLLGLLLILAGFESTLAYRQHQIAANMEALHQSLAGGEPTNEISWIPIIGQMAMGFILPFLLIFVAIPFETFISSGRTLLGKMFTWSLRVTAFGFRMIGHLVYYSLKSMVTFYDLVIFPCLWIENQIARSSIKAGRKEHPSSTVQGGGSDLINGAAACREIAD